MSAFVAGGPSAVITSASGPKTVKDAAEQYLRDIIGNESATFREGQWESIEQILKKKRVLVVQRTGWGKTMVYCIATRILRDRGEGPSLMVSPLLALMRNQIRAAESLGLVARMFVGSNYDEWADIEDELKQDKVDLLMVTPERLAYGRFVQRTLPRITGNLGLLIIDEAHCISDWGHDFRPDYRRIRRVQVAIPRNVPIVATTATANNRVVKDVRDQLGKNISVHRGSLVRKSLRLQNVTMPDAKARLAWLARAVPQMEGSGIIYTLTRKDSDLVADWLASNGIRARSYHGSSGRGDNTREELEQALLDNQLKVLVATIALGMGFDKPDLGFIIHYQRPPSVVHYYQQVGRAGRGLAEAYGLLLWGKEDDRIAEYFMDNAFPGQEKVRSIMAALAEADGGLTVPELEGAVNLKRSTIDKTLKLLALESPAPVIQIGRAWTAREDATDYEIDPEYIARLRRIRAAEQVQMQHYMKHQQCLMAFLQQALDDTTAEACGKCTNCVERDLVPVDVPQSLADKANSFVLDRALRIFPRKRWPAAHLSQHAIHRDEDWISSDFRAVEGRALSGWRDGGWGDLVWNERQYAAQYSPRLVEAAVQMLQTWKAYPRPEWVTAVPPRRDTHHVESFAQALASKLGLPYIPVVERTKASPSQSEMKNHVHRAANVADVFAVPARCRGNVLLIDDVSVSGWTVVTVAALLRHAGCDSVRPMTLAKRDLAI